MMIKNDAHRFVIVIDCIFACCVWKRISTPLAGPAKPHMGQQHRSLSRNSLVTSGHRWLLEILRGLRLSTLAAPHSAWASLRLRLFCPKSFLKSALVTTPAGLSYNSFFCPQAAFQFVSIACGKKYAETVWQAETQTEIGHHFITYRCAQRSLSANLFPPLNHPSVHWVILGQNICFPQLGLCPNMLRPHNSRKARRVLPPCSTIAPILLASPIECAIKTN